METKNLKKIIVDTIYLINIEKINNKYDKTGFFEFYQNFIKNSHFLVKISVNIYILLIIFFYYIFFGFLYKKNTQINFISKIILNLNKLPFINNINKILRVYSLIYLND